MSGFGSVRSLERGLQILQVINQTGGLKASEIAKQASIPRPTVYRLLETLESRGFVLRDHSSEKWRPTLHTKSLSSGFREEDWVSQSAIPEMVRLGRDVLWPLDLVTFNDYAMEIRESTHAMSPYSIDHGMVGRRVPVLETAGGRAWLAYCSDEERRQTLAGLERRTGMGHPFMMQDGPLEYVLSQVRNLRLGYRKAGFRDATQSISAPIFVGERVVACLTLIWTGSALPFDEAVAAYRDRLTETANRIAAAMGADQTGAGQTGVD